MNWTRRMLIAAVATAAVAVPLVIPGARADAPALGGYQMNATANAISLLIDSPSFGVPAPHTFELHKAHATTAIDSGPTSHALSSIVWPGDVYGSAGLTLAAGIFLQDPTSARYLDCSGPAHPCVPIIDNLQKGVAQIADNLQKGCGCNPSYPFKSQAFFPQGPKDNSYDAGGGVTMTTHADQNVTEATSVVQQAGFPNAFQAGAMKSVATSGLIDGQAVSQAESFVSNVSVAGVLQIQQVHSAMEVISDGAKATVTKSQLIGGLTVGGQSITFDSTGFHAGGQSQDPFGKFAKSLIDQYLTPNGISISVAPPVVTKNAGTGSINGSSLVITLNAQGMEKIVKNIPEPYRTWLQSPGSSPLAPVLQQFSTFVQGLIATPTQFDQTIEIRLGDLSIASAAAPAYIAPPLVTPLTPPGGPVAAGPLPGPQILPGSSTNNTIGGAQQEAPLAVAPVAAVAVPIGLVLLALLWMLAGATGLDRMATAATSSVAAEQCPLEKP
ncbi:MAG: hypothetical protein E6G46_06230 [Actinobacteria bacterium]|nr:MAG: hypothetical protein E6G46_06230 [Actinomycetota bacterium]